MILPILPDIIVYATVSAGLAWLFYYWLRKDLIGKFIGAFLIGLLGCILGSFLLGDILKKVLGLLQDGLRISNVNILASIIGGYTLLRLYNLFNHDRRRD